MNLSLPADVLRLATRSSPSWGGARDKPKNVCAGGYHCFGRAFVGKKEAGKQKRTDCHLAE